MIVKPEFLQSFKAINGEMFAKVMRHFGFSSASCYRLGELGLIELVSTEVRDQSPWPVAVGRIENPNHYTTFEAIDAKLGWQRTENLEGARRVWPKGSYLYFPEQGLEEYKILFVVLTPSGKRCRNGEMSAPLEALASRVRALMRESELRQELTDLGITEHVRALGVDLTAIMEHELRTPLTSVAGYAALLREDSPTRNPREQSEYWRIIESQSLQALEALEKLSLALNSRSRMVELGEVEDFDADAVLRELCTSAKERANDFIGPAMIDRLNVRYLRSTDRACTIRGNPQLFRWAVWEVLKNALIHARHGKIEVAAFTSEQMFVIDIEDDGVGVPQGADDIIFLKFFRDPNGLSHRRGKRGLGLGLFLARQIVERHLGVLVSLRAKGRGAIFRFMWPLSSDVTGESYDRFRRGA